jgi:RHS repeat-associated protein
MTYSNSDPSVGYSYDQTSYNGLTIANGKGQRTGMSDASGKTAWSFDTMGRVAQEERTIGSVTKTLAYGYNLDGSLASVTYPSGRTVKYTPSAVGRPLSAVDTGNSINYVTSATYAPQGALATAAFGANITFSAGYNNRLWPNDLKGKTSSTFFELQPSYYSNGNVHVVTNAATSARSETYGYDYLNRITSAQSGATSGQYCWSQSFGYDRYGNLTSMNNTGTGSGCWSLYSPSLSPNTYNQIPAFSYDASGNTTADGTYSYAWNGEGLQKSAGTTNYTYDGDSKRVEKSSGTFYWFGPDGLALAETDSSGNTQNEYIYFSGRRTARRDSSGNVYYYFLDQIGTSHLVTNASGAVCYDADYTPFGQELAYTTSCTQKYKFTGLERDSETGNDHTWFRNYEWNVGRWMSPDRLAGNVGNPQSLNRYTYALNNPVSLVDPTGTTWCRLTDDGQSIDYSSCVSDTDYGNNQSAYPGYQQVSQDQTVTVVASTDSDYTYTISAPTILNTPYGPTWAASLATSNFFDAVNNASCTVSSSSIDNYLTTTPLAGQGSSLMATGQTYNLDPRLLVSLAGAETTFGKNITAGQYNALNVLYNGHNSPFASWQSNINAAGRSLTNPANGYDLTNTSTMYSTYCSGSGCATGLTNLNTFMKQQGANTSALQNPCK